jgi:triosephosphate isomerase
MQERKPLVAANWKMYKTVQEAVSFVKDLQKEVGCPEDREILIAPPFTALSAVREVTQRAGFSLASQNCHFEEQGSFTGEISVLMLRDVGCRYVIIGHSERRHIFGETDEMIQKKVAAVFRHGLTPVLCLGEKLEEREEEKTSEVVSRQLESALQGLNAEQAEQLVVAYEPVWAIGTGRTATPDQAQEVHAFIRERYTSLCNKTVANRLRILYGGSVKPDNVDALMGQADIDGCLVGGASLQVDSFKRIVQYQI